MAQDPIEMFVSREGESSAAGFRLRRYLVNYETYRALDLGIASGVIQRLGEPYTFGTTTLHVGGYEIAGTEAPDWTRIDVQYVREGELRYAKIPSEVGYRNLSGSTGTSPLTIPIIKRNPLAGGGSEYITTEAKTKRREFVLTITANVPSGDINETFLSDVATYQNRLVDLGLTAGPWLFESASWTEISDRVTQVVGVFRGTDTRPEADAGSENNPGDIFLPALPPFNYYYVRLDEAGGDPEVLAVPEYDTINTSPAFFAWFLPVFPS